VGARRTVGIILGVGGALVSVVHLAWMIVTREREPYHGFLTWVTLGLVMVVVGLALMGGDGRGGDG
jgi:uncharacterized membrane protein YidH (DUF202 family)